MVTEPSHDTASRRDAECHSQQHDYIQQLPSEILLDVFLQSPDLESVHALIHTSRRFSLLFEHNALRIVESALGCPGLPAETKSLMRAVVSLRTSSFRYALDSTPRSWAEAGAVPLARYRGDGGDHWRDAPPPATLLRRFVRLARGFHVLAHEVLDGCLRRCAERGLPRYLPRPSLPRTAEEQESGDGDGDGIAQDVGHDGPSSPSPLLATRGLGSPSRAEEQRVVLALWMGCYFLELGKNARRVHSVQRGDSGEASRIEFHQPGCQREDNSRRNQDTTVGRLWPGFRGELGRMGLGILRGLEEEEEHSSRAIVPGEEDQGELGPEAGSQTQEAVLEAQGCRCEQFRLPSLRVEAQTDCPGRPGDKFLEDHEGPRARGGLVQQTRGHRLFTDFRNHSSYCFSLLQRPEWSPKKVKNWHLMHLVGPGPYRELGMFFWDEERLVALGLHARTGHGRWLRLVSADELARARRRAKKVVLGN